MKDKDFSRKKFVKEFEEILNKAFDYGVQATLDNLMLRGYDTKAMLKQECLGRRLDDDLDKDREILLSDLKNELEEVFE